MEPVILWSHSQWVNFPIDPCRETTNQTLGMLELRDPSPPTPHLPEELAPLSSDPPGLNYEGIEFLL